MYFIKRKSDNKYYKNPCYHTFNNYLYKYTSINTKAKEYHNMKKMGFEELWTNDKNNCVPFKSLNGIKKSRVYQFISKDKIIIEEVKL